MRGSAVRRLQVGAVPTSDPYKAAVDLERGGQWAEHHPSVVPEHLREGSRTHDGRAARCAALPEGTHPMVEVQSVGAF